MKIKSDMFFQVQSERPSVRPETVGSIGSFTMTNAMLMALFVTFLIAAVALHTKKKSRIVPSKFQLLLEMLVSGFRSVLTQITGSDAKALALLPLIGTLFLYLGISNLIGLIPGLTAITIDGIPALRTPTNDFNTTFSIAFAMVILTQIMSIKQFGVLGHLGKFFKFKELVAGFRKGIGDGMIAFIDFLVGLLDIVSEIAKVVSLSLRLFGNMYAGEVIMSLLFGAFAMALPSVWLGMNILVGFLQAMVFGSLTAAYYTLAVETAQSTA